jgi:hypothetical protein
MSFEAVALSRVSLLFSISFKRGHGALLLTVLLAMHSERETMSPK